MSTYPNSEHTKAEVMDLLQKQIEAAKAEYYAAIVAVALDATVVSVEEVRRAREKFVTLCQIAGTVASE